MVIPLDWILCGLCEKRCFFNKFRTYERNMRFLQIFLRKPNVVLNDLRLTRVSESKQRVSTISRVAISEACFILGSAAKVHHVSHTAHKSFVLIEKEAET